MHSRIFLTLIMNPGRRGTEQREKDKGERRVNHQPGSVLPRATVVFVERDLPFSSSSAPSPSRKNPSQFPPFEVNEVASRAG